MTATALDGSASSVIGLSIFFLVARKEAVTIRDPVRHAMSSRGRLMLCYVRPARAAIKAV